MRYGRRKKDDGQRYMYLNGYLDEQPGKKTDCRAGEREEEKEMSVLEYDSPVMSGIAKTVDIFWLSTLWFLCCLPVVTAGAATASLYSTTIKSIRRGEGYVTKNFFHAMRQNLRTGIGIWMVYLVLAALDYMGFLFAAAIKDKSFGFFVLCMYSAIGFAVYASGLYAFPVLSKCSMKCFAILRFGFGLAIKHFPYTLLLALVVAGSAVLMWYVPLFVFCVPAVGSLICSLMLERILLRYTPEH